jgi:hypothetical protein
MIRIVSLQVTEKEQDYHLNDANQGQKVAHEALSAKILNFE